MDKQKRDKFIKVGIIIYGIILVAVNAYRIELDNFWADEAFTALMANRTYMRIIANSAMDVHPPLYYFITKSMIIILGNKPWVFRIVSFIPYLLMMYWGIKNVTNKWGYSSSAIFITLISITSEALLYNIQVRMYTWTAFFVLMAFDHAGKIIYEESSKEYVLLTFYSLCAAYTHYYGLIPVFFLYIGIIIAMLIQRRGVRKILLSGVVVAALYVPWLIVLLRTMSRLTSDGYWITNLPSVKECIKYLIPLNNRYLQYLALLFILCIVLNKSYTCYKTKKSFDGNIWFYILGMMSILATTFVGELVSFLFFPAFIQRYMYPIAVVFWLLVSVLIGQFLKDRKYGAIVSIVVLFTIFVGNISNYSEYVKSINDNEKFLDTKTVIDAHIGESEVITDDSTTVFYWYYHDNECNELDKEDAVFDKSRYIAVLAKTTIEELMDRVQGYSATEICHNGIFGTKKVDVYILEK